MGSTWVKPVVVSIGARSRRPVARLDVREQALGSGPNPCPKSAYLLLRARKSTNMRLY